MPYLQQDPNEDQNAVGGSSSGAASSSGIGGGGTAVETPNSGQSAGGSYAGDGGQGATTTTAGSGASPAATQPGGGYTNLLSYLSANQGAGATTGQAAANTVQQSANDAGAKQDAYKTAAGGQIDQAASSLGVDQGNLDKINAGAASTDPNILKQIQGGGYIDPSSGQTGAGVGNGTGKYQGPAAPKTDYAGPDAASLQVAYNGPNSYSALTGDASAAQTAAIGANNKVDSMAKLAQGGQSDVSGLLRSTYTQPNYSAGENSLDAFLAGGTQGGRDALASTKGIADTTASGYQGINDMLTGKIKSANDTAAATNAAYGNAVSAAQAKSAAAGQAYQSAIDQATKDAAAHGVGKINNTIGGPFQVAIPEPNNPQDNNDLDTGLRSIGGYVNEQAQDQLSKLKDPIGTTARTITDPLWTTRTALPSQWQTASAGDKANQVASDLTNPVSNANPVSTTKNAISHAFGAAHGGQVPYEGLMKMIGGRKK